jgi:methionyl-tRNA formyltransferase
MTDLTATPLRVVVLTAFLGGYKYVGEWAARHGHEILLVVSPPLDAASRYDGNPLVLDLPASSNILTTGKLRTIAAQAIAGLRPDLIISAAFPRLIPAEILELPKYGAINCHPALLPACRGPNPARLIYEGDEQVAVTVHRTAAEFDTGTILAQRSRPLPDDLNGPAILTAWQEMFGECLDIAVPRIVAGEPGLSQNAEKASEAPFFTPDEQLIDLTEPARTVRRKVAALNVVTPHARVRIPGAGLQSLVATYAVPSTARPHEPGTVLDKHEDGWTMQTADEPLRLICQDI